jgi:hypothetical protein
MGTIKIEYRGAVAICESIEDAAALLGRLTGGATSLAGPGDGARNDVHSEGRWTVARFRDFVGRLSQPQVRMLQELVRIPHGRTAKDLAPTLNFSTPKSFGPIMAAMSKHAKKAGIGIQEVLTSERVSVGNELLLEFKATPTFMRVATEAGWRTDE